MSGDVGLTMRCEVVPLSDLSQAEIEAWATIQDQQLQFRTPHLRPELFRTIGQFNKRVYTGVAKSESNQIIFLPHLRRSWLSVVAEPVPLCDYQACIATDFTFGLSDLLRKWKIEAWRFDSLLAPAELESQLHISRASVSYRTSLPGGFDAFRRELAHDGKSLPEVPKRVRVLARDLGEIRFVPDCADLVVLDSLLRWKAERFNRGEAIPGWICATLEALMQTRTPAFSGRLSALYAGDRLVAGHFGLISRGTLYYWFPAFDREVAKYSPGWVLLHCLLRHLQEMGCDTLDFGPGGEAYKTYFSNKSIVVSSGYFERPSIANTVRAIGRYVEKAARSSPIARAVLRPALRRIRS